ncbi:MAG: hypothetical protein ACM3JF_03000 [Sphaerimonospora mesophila]
MGKSTKKRHKKYSGANAKADNVVRVHRVEAVVRSDFSQWLHDHKKFLKTVSIIALVTGAILFVIIQGIIAIAN